MDNHLSAGAPHSAPQTTYSWWERLAARSLENPTPISALRASLPYTNFFLAPHFRFSKISLVPATLQVNQMIPGQCSRIRILCFFQISKKHDFLRFFEMTYQKVVKSL